MAPGSNEQFTHTPGQIAFSPDGAKLIVTTKAAGQSIEVFGTHTLTAVPVVDPLPGAVPFAVAFDHQSNLLVTEAGPNAVASFRLHGNGTVSLLDEAKTEQAATCWIVGAQGFFYVSNAGSASLTGLESAPGGQLTRLEPNTGTHPGTVDAASVGNFVYVQGGKEGTVDEFEVEPSGALKSIGSVLVPDAEGGEGIVAG